MSSLVPEAEQRILVERARTLSLPLAQDGGAGETIEVLVFTRGGNRFGVEAVRVVEAVPPLSLTPLPGARPFLAGAIQHRGRILGVFDLVRLLALPIAASTASPVRVVVVQARGMTFGLQADEVSGVVRVDVRDVAAADAATSGGRQAWLRAPTADMVSILDVDALARDPRLTVDDE